MGFTPLAIPFLVAPNSRGKCLWILFGPPPPPPPGRLLEVLRYVAYNHMKSRQDGGL